MLSKKARIAQEWARIREAFGYRCAYCGEVPARMVREHMWPRSRGGGDEPENIVPACHLCNSRKGYLTPLEWFLARIENPPRLRPNVERRVYRPLRCKACDGTGSVGELGVWNGRSVFWGMPCLACHPEKQAEREAALKAVVELEASRIEGLRAARAAELRAFEERYVPPSRRSRP